MSSLFLKGVKNLRIQTALVFAQQLQSRLSIAAPLQHNADTYLHSQVLLPMLFGEFLCLCDNVLPLLQVCQQLYSNEVWCLFAREFG